MVLLVTFVPSNLPEDGRVHGRGFAKLDDRMVVIYHLNELGHISVSLCNALDILHVTDFLQTLLLLHGSIPFSDL